MKLVFVSGPYTGKNAYDREWNIRRAEHLAVRIWHVGAMGICVHSMNRYLFGEISEEDAMDGDIELMKRCDAICMTVDWSDSKGAKREWLIAQELGIPTFYERDLKELEAWLLKEADNE